MFKTISDKLSLPDLEKEILDRWKANRIFEKSIEARQNQPYGTLFGNPYLRNTQGELVTLNGLPQIDPTQRV